jgi:uncharacterized damage-inducible protein DinB
MKDKAYLRGLLEYNGWANEDLFGKVSELPAGEVTRKRAGSLESISVNLHHLLVIDRIWLAHMEGRDHGYKDRRGTFYDTLEALWDARRETDARLLEYLDSLAPDALEEPVTYRLIGSTSGTLSRAMCFTHLVMHGSYHRGWIADMFCQAGARQPVADIPVYERAAREAGLNPLP